MCSGRRRRDDKSKFNFFTYFSRSIDREKTRGRKKKWYVIIHEACVACVTCNWEQLLKTYICQIVSLYLICTHKQQTQPNVKMIKRSQKNLKKKKPLYCPPFYLSLYLFSMPIYYNIFLIKSLDSLEMEERRSRKTSGEEKDEGGEEHLAICISTHRAKCWVCLSKLQQRGSVHWNNNKWELNQDKWKEENN